MNDGDRIDLKILKELSLPHPLNAENFQELAGKATIEKVSSGKQIFKAGDVDRKTIYLLDGDISLVDGTGKKTLVRSGTETSRKALANFQPRQHTAKANTECKITRIDSDLLDILTTWDQVSGIEVSEIREAVDDGADQDWMTLMLREKAFLNVPAANIQAMFMKMEEISVVANQHIVNQGDDGDFYYIIRKGSAKVTRKSKSGDEIVLATLNVGMAFGEEALVSGSERNASVVMESEGSLMRLSGEDFEELLKEPMLSKVSMAKGLELVNEGAEFLDVRLEEEFRNNGIKGSQNIPLFMLRLEIASLDSNKSYVVYCDTGRRSSAAAFLLSERGFETYVIQGGLLEG